MTKYISVVALVKEKEYLKTRKKRERLRSASILPSPSGGTDIRHWIPLALRKVGTRSEDRDSAFQIDWTVQDKSNTYSRWDRVALATELWLHREKQRRLISE